METIEPTTQLARDYPVKPVPFTAVHCDDVFWAPRIETNRTVTVPFTFQQCELSGRMDLFRRAAGSLRGHPTVDRAPPGFPFDETDLYKVIEGALPTNERVCGAVPPHGTGRVLPAGVPGDVL
jgi:hypothetical protein